MNKDMRLCEIKFWYEEVYGRWDKRGWGGSFDYCPNCFIYD